MNDLVTYRDRYPTLIPGLDKLNRIFDSIESFEDIERVFLQGAGLSPNTYRSYLEAVKQLYTFTDGKHPLQIMPADIEMFYDDLKKKGDPGTAYCRVQGLKHFFKGVSKITGLPSPFEIMGEKLTKKLNEVKAGNRTKKALSINEIRKLITFLAQDDTVIGQENYALCYMLTTSGLRAFEMCQLKWEDLEFFEGAWTARFTGKGSKVAEQELFSPAVEAARSYFRAQFKRDPVPADHLFWTQESFGGNIARPLEYHALYCRIKKIGAKLAEKGIIRRKLTWSPHLFRRTYATTLYKSGMKLKALAEKTRHSNLDILTEHYIDDREAAAPYFAKMFEVAV